MCLSWPRIDASGRLRCERERERERDDGDAYDADACLSVVAPVGILVWDFS